ncbi:MULTISPECIES: BMP family ABC transporter substrate-binding protein [Devosia]|mgnify:FL=1|uniref:Membrane lipoprotein TmpC n=1 Tax=Devosia equisanguinis TaxID=2490941 RepID=A0A3S4EJF6_9HYPH|nr:MULTISPECIES: BMP family ABC transporter substrate-binding protein [Devosia]ODT48074.1 MAG: BMP family ABC transporter substrate-binding protein [Pelagibacterium sp. SCN 63-126]ODU85723.1 MAG: BMP family ABC transporter substrate-binding protein [Pelagibacterium sp. SCN 63-17]OJX42218.1 MAG: BMP family ABC transporter substrate-binding protein [Devosia sp. 63-57]VDS03256.1 Membrane lipoprotein TmpC precursor [Devosia equisanguinis]
MTSFKLTRRAFTGLAVAGLMASVSAGAVFAQEYTKENPLKVALVVHGNLGDKSFFDSAAAGLAKAEAELPVDVTIIEAGLDRGRWEPALADATDQGYDVVIGGTWEMNGFMQALAPEYPETKFIIFDDAPDFTGGAFPNILAINYRVSTAGYLAGYAAAKISKTGKLGEILGVEGTTVVEFALGFEQGAKAANPDVQVTRAVAGSFTDPAKGKELALAQFAQGVDIVFPIAGGTGIGALQAARDEGKLAVGVDSDQAEIFAPTDPAQADVIFTSVEKKVGESLYTALVQTLDGTAPYGTNLILGLADGAVGIAKNSYYEKLVPADVRAEVDEQEAKIISGEIVVDTGMK